MKPRCFRLSMDSNVEDAVVASTMMRGLLDQLHIARCDADMVELCLTEALVNAVKHAYRGMSGHEIRVDFELESGAIAFEIVTTGHRTTKEKLAAAADKAVLFDPEVPEDLPECGRGMLIITEGMDEWDYFQRGPEDVLRMRKTLTKSETANH